MSTFSNIVHSVLWKLMENIQSCIISMAIAYRKKTMKYIRVIVGIMFTVSLSFSLSMNPIHYSKHRYCCNSYPDVQTGMTIQGSFCCRKHSFLMQDKLWVKMGLNPSASFKNLNICKNLKNNEL